MRRKHGSKAALPLRPPLRPRAHPSSSSLLLRARPFGLAFFVPGIHISRESRKLTEKCFGPDEFLELNRAPLGAVFSQHALLRSAANLSCLLFSHIGQIRDYVVRRTHQKDFVQRDEELLQPCPPIGNDGGAASGSFK